MDQLAKQYRRPNSNPSKRLLNRNRDFEVRLTVPERNCLHRYESGGGLQLIINEILDLADPNDPLLFSLNVYITIRIIKYVNNTGGGGPNDALRKAFARSLFAHGLIHEMVYQTWRAKWPHVVS